MVGQWTFEQGEELVDRTGNFGDLTLNGNATVSGGALTVSGTGNTASGWALTGDYHGSTITNKTLVSWVDLNSLGDGANSGSALSIDNIYWDMFDGIVFSELQPNTWMNGSNNGTRTNGGSFSYPQQAETMGGQLLRMAITYAYDSWTGAMTVSGYRNDTLLGSYVSNDASLYYAGYTEVMFGLRHTYYGTPLGALNATIHEARIYDTALSASEISSLSMAPVAPVPVPASMPLLFAGIAGLYGMKRRRRA